jgi:hypothetical protein
MRREWNSVKSRSDEPMRTLRSVTSPNVKVPAFSRKKSRFSGKNREKRVRFTRSWSTSTWEKSVRNVASAVMRGVMPHLRSNPPSTPESPAPRLVRDPDALEADAYGFTVRFCPECRSRNPWIVPARDILWMSSRRANGAQ